MKRALPFVLVFLVGCIGEDVVQDEIPASIRFINPVVSLEIGTQYQFEYSSFDEVGKEIVVESIEWSSSDESLLSIDEFGLASALDYGDVEVQVSAMVNGTSISDELIFSVTDETVLTSARFGNIESTSSYDLEGVFSLSLEDDNLIISVEEGYTADDGLPGLYLYLTNNPTNVSGAFEVGAVTTFEGVHTYQVTDVGLFEYNYLLYWCKPFSVKVGDGEIMDL